VTPKEGARERQPRAVAPALAAVAVLVGVAAFGLLRDQEPATLNNVAFAALHVAVLSCGHRAPRCGGRRPRRWSSASRHGKREAVPA